MRRQTNTSRSWMKASPYARVIEPKTSSGARELLVGSCPRGGLRSAAIDSGDRSPALLFLVPAFERSVVVAGTAGFLAAADGGWAVGLPDTWSMHTFSQPASASRSVCASMFCSRVDTRAYPTRVMPGSVPKRPTVQGCLTGFGHGFRTALIGRVAAGDGHPTTDRFLDAGSARSRLGPRASDQWFASQLSTAVGCWSGGNTG
jgi:hypothetical protein